MCIADDIYAIMLDYNQTCIAWDSFLPGLTPTLCPGAVQNYERPFVNCEAAPYSFNNPWRSLFFVFEWQAPSVNQFLLTTSFILVAWIREVFPGIMTFPFPPGQPTQTFISCFYVTAGNFASLMIMTILLLVLTILLVFAIAQLIIALFQLFTIALIMVLHGTRSASGADSDRNQYYVTRDEIYAVPNAPVKATPPALASGRYDYNNNNNINIRRDYVANAYPHSSAMNRLRNQFYSIVRLPKQKQKTG